MKKQYAALPFRKKHRDLEILLITSRRKGRWIIPKGWPKAAVESHVSAAEEAYEEAGVSGRINRRRIGTFQTRKRKRKRKINCEVDVFPFAVTRQSCLWPEKGQRRLRWLRVGEAARIVRKEGLRQLLVSIEKNPGKLNSVHRTSQ
jgi:8-oxo-dGTP pyrophosphatase MutT (NUDIX family)